MSKEGTGKHLVDKELEETSEALESLDRREAEHATKNRVVDQARQSFAKWLCACRYDYFPPVSKEVELGTKSYNRRDGWEPKAYADRFVSHEAWKAAQAAVKLAEKAKRWNLDSLISESTADFPRARRVHAVSSALFRKLVNEASTRDKPTRDLRSQFAKIIKSQWSWLKHFHSYYAEMERRIVEWDAQEQRAPEVRPSHPNPQIAELMERGFVDSNEAAALLGISVFYCRRFLAKCRGTTPKCYVPIQDRGDHDPHNMYDPNIVRELHAAIRRRKP